MKLLSPSERRADVLAGGAWLWRDGGDHREPVRARQGADAVQPGDGQGGAIYRRSRKGDRTGTGIGPIPRFQLRFGKRIHLS